MEDKKFTTQKIITSEVKKPETQSQEIQTHRDKMPRRTIFGKIINGYTREM